MQKNLFYYSFNFESTVITQPSIDGWLCNLDYTYLNVDAPVGQEERLIVMGNYMGRGAYRYFSVIPGYHYEFKYDIAHQDEYLTLDLDILQRNDSSDPLTNLFPNTYLHSSGTTTNTISFTPTKSEIYIHMASKAKSRNRGKIHRIQ